MVIVARDRAGYAGLSGLTRLPRVFAPAFPDLVGLYESSEFKVCLYVNNHGRLAGALDIARELAPGVPRGLLTWLDFPIGQAVAMAGHLDVQVLAPHWGSLRPNDVEPQLHRPLECVVDLVHASGREFLAWCPGVAFAQRLLDAGVDALCVNNVPKVLAEPRGERLAAVG